MTSQSTLAATVFAVAAAFALSASAATEQAAADTQKAAQTAEQKAEQKTQGTTCPCLEEKSGAAAHMPNMHDMHGMRANQGAPAKVNPMFDRSKHYHPRDGGKL